VSNAAALDRSDVWGSNTYPFVTTRVGTAQQIRGALPDAASNILITKIMLGVFGCVPAFATYFKRGFGAWTFGTKALMRVAEFYRSNTDVINRHRV
jgi:hypothetical protein